MYVIGLESSKTRGMGHLFRGLLYASYLRSIREPFIILINDDKRAMDILKSKGIMYRVVNYEDNTDWESEIIDEYKAEVWIQDKYETPTYMAVHIKKHRVLFCVIDDFGPGAEMSDIHFAGMIYLTGYRITGRKVFYGPDYVILNPEIDYYKRVRTKISNIIITLGGSDPYGMTIDVVREISKTDYSVRIIIGPSFGDRRELEEVNVKGYPILQNVSSLLYEFSKCDFAITGGGVTCCEANSCGVPCLIIANAPHEKKTGLFMQENGGAIYAGSFEGWDKNLINCIGAFDVERMSRAGMDIFDTKAINRIFDIIEQERMNR